MLILHPSFLELFIRAPGPVQTLLASRSKRYRHYIVSRIFPIVLDDEVVLRQLDWLEVTAHGLLRGKRCLDFTLFAFVSGRMAVFEVLVAEMVPLKDFVGRLGCGKGEPWNRSDL